MKKIILSIILGALLIIPTLVLAQTATGTETKDTKVTGEINKIFEIKKGPDGKPLKGLEYIDNISKSITSNKESSFSDLFAGIIKILTGVAVVMTFVGSMVAGGYYVFSEGEEDRTTKARTIMIYVIIGDLIIAVSYAVIKAITMIKPL